MGMVQEWNSVHAPVTRIMTCTMHAWVGKRDRTKMASSQDTSTLVNASKRIY